jgi:thioredoxin reductase
LNSFIKFNVKTEDNNYTGKTVLFATGTKWRKLEVPGSNEWINESGSKS